MIAGLLSVVSISVVVSACCSLTEASLLAVPLAHVKHLADSGSRRGKILLQFKEHLSQPIAAILILNTVANTVGAAVAGAMVHRLYGQQALVFFSLAFTLTILYLSEIIPKQLGATYARRVSSHTAIPLFLVIKALYPLVRVAEIFANAICRGGFVPSVSAVELLSMAEIGREEGVIDHLEGSVIRNVIGLDRLLVKDVQTPRVVVFRLSDETPISAVRDELLEWSHTRVPIYPPKEPDNVTRYIIQRDIYRAFLKGDDHIVLKDIARPMSTVSEFMRADKLLLQMFEKREPICSVIDEHGGFAGIVTLEDVIEEIVGREIIDEYDLVSDLRSYAQILHSRSLKDTRRDGRDRDGRDNDS